MANVKITQLPAASTVTANVDVLPMVHSGVTQKVTPDQIVNQVLKSPGAIGNTAPFTGAFTSLSCNTITSNGAATLNGTSIPFSVALVDTTTAQAVANKTLYDAKIPDSELNNFYSLKGSALAGNYDATLPVITSNDVFVFEAATQTLTNKTLDGFNITDAVLLSGSAGSSGQVLTSAGPGLPPTWTAGGGGGGSGTVTSVSGTGTVSGITLSGTVTTSGSLTLGGTLDLSAYNAAGAFTTLTSSSTTTLNGTSIPASKTLVDTDSSQTLSSKTLSSAILTGTVTAGGGVGTSGQLLASTGTGVQWVTASATGITSISIASANGLAGTSSGGSTPTVTLSTSVTGVLKGNGTAISAAVSGTDYAPATSGTSILYGDGSGGFSSVTVGSGLSFTAGTLAATNTGTVTTVSVVSANGFAGTVANATTTPAITLTTSITGVLKGNGTAISAAVSGTDYAPATSGTSILKGNGAGGFSSATSGTDYAPATSGTSILKGNGSGGFSSASAGTDYQAAITATGILKGAGAGSVSSATAGTDYVSPTGAETLTNKTLNNPTVTNYVESVVAIGTVTTTNTLSLTNGTVQTATLTASTACTFTMPTAVAGKSFILLLKQAASTGNGSATFTGVKWDINGTPTITATAGKMDILTFVSDGTNWYGSIAQGYTP